MPNIESLLSARLFLAPQLWKDRIYFISNISGHFSLYAMDYGGSVPEPLLPPNIALQNPELIGGASYAVYPELGKVVVSIDKDGDEVYRPMIIPIEGGLPEPAFGGPQITDARVFSLRGHRHTNTLFMLASSLTESINKTYLGDLASGDLEQIYESAWGGGVGAANDDNTEIVIVEGYTVGDETMYLWKKGGQREPLIIYGTPISERTPGQKVPLSGFGAAEFTEDNKGLLLTNSLVEDTYGLGYMDMEKPGEIAPVAITGARHNGMGEMYNMEHLYGDRYIVQYNIDGASWAYDGVFDQGALTMKLEHVVCGEGALSNGVMNAIHYDEDSDRFILSFSTAASPTQIYTVEGINRKKVVKHTRERVLGIPQTQLSLGEDASFTTHDGLRVSARLYMPSKELGFEGQRPVVYYVHGGPQGQERPNFAWFSMPLIQFLTLNGFAVFVPNARGSTGYGLSYTKRVDRDWGGDDRLDHVHAMTQVLPKDPRLDVSRTGVIGRSYGGYMTLTLAMRHPKLWSAAVDMFGPYDLVTSFLERIPETWKPYFYESLGHPEKDVDFLNERSPKTYMNDLEAPMLVIQGANDPRVVEQESRDVVESLRAAGKQVDYLMFENEGHDVIKYENKVRCYNTITDFFKEHLRP